MSRMTIETPAIGHLKTKNWSSKVTVNKERTLLTQMNVFQERYVCRLMSKTCLTLEENFFFFSNDILFILTLILQE